MPISSISIAAICQTNMMEAEEFFRSYVSLKTVSAVVACWIVPLPLLLKLRALRQPVQGRSAWLLTGLLLLLAVSFTVMRSPQKAWKYNPVYQIYVAYDQYRAMHDAVASLSQEYIDQVLKEYPVSREDNTPVTLVVVIGESASRRHHGYYGYPRDTTPFMSARKSELLVFSDMISPAPNTAAAHTQYLLFPLENESRKLPVMKALNSVGIETWWITSQYSYDTACSPLPFLADHVVGLNNSVDQCQFFDDIILPELRDVLQQSSGRSCAIFLNIMGSHVKYDARYPDSFARFSGSTGMTSPWASVPDARQIINTYDNSILYTDFILEQVIRMLEKVPNAALIYLSDHGQDVFDEEKRFGHTMNQNSGFEIPFFLWMSPSFRAWRGEDVHKWKDYVTRPAMADCLSFLMTDLLNIRVKSAGEALSPLSEAWKPRRRVASGYVYDR